MSQTPFLNLAQKIELETREAGSRFSINGISSEQWALAYRILESSNDNHPLKQKNIVCLFHDNEKAEKFYNNIKTISSHEVLRFPGQEAMPYLGFIPSERDLAERFFCLSHLSTKEKPALVVTVYDSLFLKLPPADFFQDNRMKLVTEDIIGPLELASKLVALGYVSSPSVEEPGSFSSRGEIFDIYPIGAAPVRLHYFDDLIEKIFALDPLSQRTIKEKELPQIEIDAGPGALTKESYSHNLREKIPMPPTGKKAKYERRKQIFNHLSEGLLFEDYGNYLPLFFDKHHTLADYLGENSLALIFDSSQVEDEVSRWLESARTEFEFQSQDPNSDFLLPGPEELFQKINSLDDLNLPRACLNEVEVFQNFEDNHHNVTLRLEPAGVYLQSKIGETKKGKERLYKTIHFVNKEFTQSGKLTICYQSSNFKSDVERLFTETNSSHGFISKVNFIQMSLEHGFFYENEKHLVLSEADFYQAKRSMVSEKRRKKNVDLFAEQLSSLKEGDFIIHNDHGIGKYLGIEPMEFGGKKDDYLIIEYADKDKVYLPVYKLDLIQKYADSVSQLKPESLRKSKFNKVKSRAQASAKKLAFDLLRLQAERESAVAHAFTPPDDLFKDFEKSFPYKETPDQADAIDSVLYEMQKAKPMDFLVCGDVGFGKTEVAMRAAFKAVLDQKQTAILVPTTVLALQHFHSFKKRFKGFAVNIEFLSRFKSAKETKEIIEKLGNGQIDIIIGTHKLLSDKVKFSDLGLVIVDEEQRFGVTHKEKFKVLKNSLDFLTLTATPIPRTLQLAFLGIRKLSLIQTAPPRRQSIKTYIIKQDDHTIQSAIQKELRRGGQVFIVHNKVQDIESFAANIKDLVPNASLKFAHGQMPEKELESIMKDFYEGKFQILISTTIIESGIDIPNANTMIIDRADTFGLSQLHQLRGRIGRSDRKAYAYFLIPNNRNVTEVAQKRLKALQTYADMGSGFNIASSDLEIRGAGDILGAEQSGHIEAVGLELYTELLKDAVAELKGEKRFKKSLVEINIAFPSYIPGLYIENNQERLKLYKRFSNLETEEEIDFLSEETVDRFGRIPQEMDNLIYILKTRINLGSLGVTSLSQTGTSLALVFLEEEVKTNNTLREYLVKICLERPNSYQISPDYKLTYKPKKEITPESIYQFSQELKSTLINS